MLVLIMDKKMEATMFFWVFGFGFDVFVRVVGRSKWVIVGLIGATIWFYLGAMIINQLFLLNPTVQGVMGSIYDEPDLKSEAETQSHGIMFRAQPSPFSP